MAVVETSSRSLTVGIYRFLCGLVCVELAVRSSLAKTGSDQSVTRREMGEPSGDE
jgi:hypothetical protein